MKLSKTTWYMNKCFVLHKMLQKRRTLANHNNYFLFELVVLVITNKLYYDPFKVHLINNYKNIIPALRRKGNNIE